MFLGHEAMQCPLLDCIRIDPDLYGGKPCIKRA
jgi:uncharacterized protein (DUF433 family)